MGGFSKTASYPLGATLRKMLRNVTKLNPSLYGRFALYTFAASLYPFLGVLLPRFMIEELQKGAQASVRTVVFIVVLYFAAASILGFLRTYIINASYTLITKLRIDYLRDTCVKLMEMAYPHAEDAGFMEKYDKAMMATESNDNGVEGVYHKLFELPAIVITVVILAAVIGKLSPLILAGLLLNLAAALRISRKAHAFRYAHKEADAKWQRKIRYYNEVTSDFTYGKDIRMFGMKQRILDNYSAEIKGYTDLQHLLAQREYIYSFLGLLTLLISDGLTYGILISRTLRGMSIASFSMYLTAAITMSLYLKRQQTRLDLFSMRDSMSMNIIGL